MASEYQNKLDGAFGEAGNLDDVLKQGVREGELDPATAQKPESEIVTPEQTEETVETQEVETTETVEAEQTEEEAENQTLTEEEETKPDKHRDTKAEARIAKLIRERERLRGQLDAIRQTQRVETPGEPPVDPDAPNPASYPEGEKDIDYKVDVKLYHRDRQQKQQAFKAQQQEMVKKFPDMPELLEMDRERVASGIQTANPTVVRLIQDSDVSGDLWHYLLANSDEAIRIASMDPLRTAKEIGKIEARLAIPELVPEPVKAKKPLPPPIKPVKATKTNSTAGVKNFGFQEF